jgi:hypothetical protein
VRVDERLLARHVRHRSGGELVAEADQAREAGRGVVLAGDEAEKEQDGGQVERQETAPRARSDGVESVLPMVPQRPPARGAARRLARWRRAAGASPSACDFLRRRWRISYNARRYPATYAAGTAT